MQEPGSEYSHLDPEEDGLGPLEENDLIAFAYQIADGMVRALGGGIESSTGWGLALWDQLGMVLLKSGCPTDVGQLVC